jgi:hypothetical protein
VERVVGGRTKVVRARNPCGLLAISKCEGGALEEECLAPLAKKGKISRLRSQKRNRPRGSPVSPTLQHQDEPAKVALRFVFGSARLPLDSMISCSARSFLSRPPDCVHGGSTTPLRRRRDQDTARHEVRRLVFPARRQTQSTRSRNLGRTPGNPAIKKARSPPQVASRIVSCGFQLISFPPKNPHHQVPDYSLTMSSGVWQSSDTLSERVRELAGQFHWAGFGSGGWINAGTAAIT